MERNCCPLKSVQSTTILAGLSIKQLYILCRISLSRPGAPDLCKRLRLSTRFELSAPWSEAPQRCSQDRWFWWTQFLRIWGFWSATSIIVCCSQLEFDSDVSNLLYSDIQRCTAMYSDAQRYTSAFIYIKQGKPDSVLDPQSPTPEMVTVT